MKIAIIKTGGKQYRVIEGQTVKIEKLEKNTGDQVKFETLLVADDEGANVEVGAPSLGERVTGEVTGAGKADKVTVIKYKRKTRYKRTLGHRQQFTAVQINAIA